MKPPALPLLRSWIFKWILLIMVACLLVLFWFAGEHLGKSLARLRSQPASTTRGSWPLETSQALHSGATTNEVSPASTAALLEFTLQHLRDIPEGRGFMTRLEEARLIRDLSQSTMPQLQALVEALLEEGSSGAEEMAGRLMGPVLLARDPEAVWAWIRDGAGTGSEARIRFLSGTGAVFTAWAKRDPAAAMAAWNREAVPLVQAGKLDGNGLGGIFRSWAETHPAAALEAADQVTDPAMRESAVHGIASSLSKIIENDPATWPPDADALVNRILAVSGEKAAKGLQGLVKGRLQYQPPAEVAAWADRIEMTPAQKTIFNKALADPWMEIDPAAAADWYLNRIPAGDSAGRSAALERTIRKWTHVEHDTRLREIHAVPDLAAASDWLIAQGLGPSSQGAMATLARAWGQAREPEAAVAWARALPDETARAEAMAAVTEEIRQRYPNDWPRYVKP